MCKQAKKAMEDCQIDGSKVAVAYARMKVQRNPSDAAGDSSEDCFLSHTICVLKHW